MSELDNNFHHVKHVKRLRLCYIFNDDFIHGTRATASLQYSAASSVLVQL